MAEIHPLEDQSGPYVMGELSDAESAAFESAMASSTELRMLVRDLEEGLSAIAMTAPRQNPPSKIWKRIEQLAAKEARLTITPNPRKEFSLNGWGAAAACLLGWLLYAIWVNHSGTSKSLFSREDGVQPTVRREMIPVSPPLIAANSGTSNSPNVPAKDKEKEALRNQIASLKLQLAQTSQAVTRQQALLADPSRMKFFQIQSSIPDGQNPASKQLSPDLQRALFLGMARQLGWLPEGTTPAGVETIVSGHSSSNQWKVDFVDLPNGGSASAPIPTPKLEADNSGNTPVAPLPVAASPSGTLPAFISGENVIIAIDSAIAAKGSYLSFSSNDGQPLGGAVVGDDPLVVTIPTSNASVNPSNGVSIVVGTTTPAGVTNSILFSAP